MSVAALPDDTGAPLTQRLAARLRVGRRVRDDVQRRDRPGDDGHRDRLHRQQLDRWPRRQNPTGYDGHGLFTFRLTSGSPFAGQGSAAFTTVCAMRYSGQAGMAASATNVVLATDQAPLSAGTGPANTQP